MKRVFAGAQNIAPTFEPICDYYIEPQTSLVGRSLRVLKHNDIFAVLDNYGDIGVGPECPEGLFLRDTRHLSEFDLRFEGKRPLLLGSAVEDDNASLSVDLTNPDIHVDAGISIPRDTIAMERTKLLFNAGCYERIGFFNYDHRATSVSYSDPFWRGFSRLVRSTWNASEGARNASRSRRRSCARRDSI